MASSKITAFVILSLVVLVLGIVLGAVIGFFSAGGRAGQGVCLRGVSDRIVSDEESGISDRLLREMKAHNIREFLREMTVQPQLAGTPADKAQAEKLKAFWIAQGMNTVKLYPYNVLLSYPDSTAPNHVTLLGGQGSVLFTSQLREKVLRPEQNHSNVVPPFNAYSAAGSPKGDLVYVNYGRVEDFTWLKEQKNVDFTGKIAIVKYGKIFRGDKAKNAEAFGASGLIIYSDPADYAIEGTNLTYPDYWYLPETGVQRGSLQLNGDPLTPGYPAIDSAYRIPEEEAGLPKIPVHPISYGDALKFLQNMRGDAAPSDWQGKLPITYRLGPGFMDPEWKVQMHIHTKRVNATIYNVVGLIKGNVEPDRYVVLGNHRDSWVFGAMDPVSGTAAMMEVTRAFGKLLQEGWRPRRTMVFCSWGAEEYGLIGSKEWVEQFGKILGARTVAYLNVDIAVQGNFSFRGRGLPMLKKALYTVTGKIENPNEEEISKGRTTVFDTWAERVPLKDNDGNKIGLPRVNILGSGSDYEPFINLLGITCVDFRYNMDTSLGLSSYPLYHSAYETFHLMQKYYDPDFKFHLAVAQSWGELGRWLADSLILPFDLNEYADALKEFVDVVETQYGDLLRRNKLSEGLTHMQDAADKFAMAVKGFEGRIDQLNPQNPFAIRMINDQMMLVERAFIDPLGLPSRPFSRNILFAPSQHNSYAGSSFPGLVDALFEIEKSTTDREERWRVVRKHLSVITFIIESAASTLYDPVDF